MINKPYTNKYSNEGPALSEKNIVITYFTYLQQNCLRNFSLQSKKVFDYL